MGAAGFCPQPYETFATKPWHLMSNTWQPQVCAMLIRHLPCATYTPASHAGITAPLYWKENRNRVGQGLRQH